MATLLTPRGDEHPTESTTNWAEAITRGLGGNDHPSEPEIAVIGSSPAASRIEPGSDNLPSYVQGVSLSGILQMLNLERKTCALEITSNADFGTLTLVNGELVDADVDGLEGEEAVYAILSWRRPRTTILDGVTLFRHTVDLPISRLLLESVRRQDETAGPDHAGIRAAIDRLHTSAFRDAAVGGVSDCRLADWKWLVDTLVISGAKSAAVVHAKSDLPLAYASEFGRSEPEPSEAEIEHLAPVARSVRRWTRTLHCSITEIVATTEERKLLIAPLPPDRTVFVYAEIENDESLDLARGAIRSLGR